MIESSTRQEIIQLLQKKRFATARELSQALGTTEQNIRYHMKILERENLIRISGKQKFLPDSIGRKSLVYRLSENVSEDNLSHLVGASLKLLRKKSLKDKALFLQLAKEMFPPGRPLSGNVDRLNNAIQRLNHHHYNARWEARPDGPHFLFNNCPYSTLLPIHPELCRLDCTILEILVGFEFTLVKQIQPEDPASYCRLRPA